LKEDFSNKGILVYSTSYKYEKDKLKEAAHEFNNQKFLKKYSYNKDSTITYKIYFCSEQLLEPTEVATGVFSLKNGNIVKQVDKTNKDYLYTDIMEIKYDSNSNPLKNVLGIGLLLDTDYSINNVVEIMHTTSLQKLAMHITSFRNSIIPFKSVNTATYTYDEEGYPLTKTFYNDGKLDYKLLYIY
jgi:hypothetical protein